MTAHAPIIAAATGPRWTTSIISILIVVAIAGKAFGGRHDPKRLRSQWRRRESPR
jgi:hypothetical protein